MASNSVNYFLQEDIDDLLKCSLCKIRYDIPKSLPCSGSICLRCEVELPNKFNCPFCNEEHEKLENGFPIDKTLQKMTSITPRLVNRSKLHVEASDLAERVNNLSNNFRNDIDKNEIIIKDYCTALRDKIDIRTESIKKEIDDHRDSFLKEVNSYEKHCLKNNNNLANFEDFLKNFNDKHINWSRKLDQPYIPDNEVNELIKEVNQYKNHFECYSGKLESITCKNEKLRFKESQEVLKKTMIGSIEYTSIFNEIDLLKALVSTKSIQFNPSYNGNETLILEMDDNKFAMLAKHSSDKISIKLYTMLTGGKLIKKIEEEFIYDLFYAVDFKNYLIVAFQKTVPSWYQFGYINDFIIKIYDENLDEIQKINCDYEIKGLYANEKSVYIHVLKNNENWLIVYAQKDGKLFQLVEERNTSQSGIFTSPNNEQLNQIFIRNDRIYSYGSYLLEIYDLIDLKKLKIIDFKKESGLFWPISENLFLFYNSSAHNWKVFNKEQKLLAEGLVSNANTMTEISTFFITKNGYLALIDKNASILYIKFP